MVAKRKVPSFGLERRVRPRREEEYDVEPEDSEVSSGDDEVSEEGNGRGEEDEDDESEGESGSDSGSEVRYLDRRHTSTCLQCHNSLMQTKPPHQK